MSDEMRISVLKVKKVMPSDTKAQIPLSAATDKCWSRKFVEPL